MFSPGSALLCTTSCRGSADTKVWDVGTGECLQTVMGGGASFSSDGSKVLSVTELGVAMVWDSTTFALLQALEPAPTFGAEPRRQHIAQFSLSGSFVLGIIYSGYSRSMVWNANTGEIVQALNILESEGAEFSRDGSLVLALRRENNEYAVSIWDVQTGECLLEFKTERRPLLDALIF